MTLTQLAAAIMDDNISREDLRDLASGVEADADPLWQALDAMDELLTQTVDADLAYGIGLSEGEAEARAKCLEIFERYGDERYQAANRTVEGMPT